MAGDGGEDADNLFVPSLADILGKIDDEVEEENRQIEAEANRPLALQPGVVVAGPGGPKPIDELLWSGNPVLAKAVAVCGEGLLVLPLVSRASGEKLDSLLDYGSLKVAAEEKKELEERLGRAQPQQILEELSLSERTLAKRMTQMDSDAIRDEVTILEEWHRRANGRMCTLKKRAAWAVLGIAHTEDQAAIKRAFKRKALELHPDKGGNADHFQLLQEMREVLLFEPVEGTRRPRGKASGKRGDKAAGEKKKDGAEKEADDALKKAESESDDSEESEASQTEPEPPKKDIDDEDGAYSWMDDSHKERAKLEASRRRVHRAARELWARATQLADDVERLSNSSAQGDAVRSLRASLERFTVSELATLRPGNTEDAVRLHNLFVNQAAEVLCVASAIDHVTALAEVAMKVNQPLLAAAPSPQLERQCAGLLEAIKAVPLTYGQLVAPLEAKFAADEKEPSGPEEVASHLRVLLILPESSSPGSNSLELSLPKGASVADLRARCAQLLKEPSRLRLRGGKVLPEGDTLLSSIEGLHEGAEVLLEPDTLDAEYPTWATAGSARLRNGGAGSTPALVPVSSEVAATAEKATAPAQKVQPVHEFGCTCFKCIKRRQFRK